MIEDLTRGRIWKGSVSQITVVAFPHCYDPAKVSDLILDFYTTEGGYAIEFSGETIEMSGNTATVVLQAPQLDMLDDGLLRYIVEYDYDGEHKVADLETKFYLKTPNGYTPIEVVTPEEVEEIVDEKIEEKNLPSKEYVQDYIEGALSEYNKTDNFKTINGNSIIGQGNIEIQGGGVTPEDVEDIVSSALTAYTPTANFATINGSGITDGGNILIEKGAKSYFLDKMTTDEKVALYNELFAYRQHESNFDPSKYIFFYFMNDDACYGYHQVEIARFDSGNKIYFTGIAVSRSTPVERAWHIKFALTSAGAITEAAAQAVMNSWAILTINPETGAKVDLRSSTSFGNFFSGSYTEDLTIKVRWRASNSYYYFSQNASLIYDERAQYQRALYAELQISGNTYVGVWDQGGNNLTWGLKPSGGSIVSWSQMLSGGTQIATITIDGVSQNVYAPNGGGGESNYVIVDALSDITVPYEGLKAFVREKYEDLNGIVITPVVPGGAEEGEAYAGRFIWVKDGGEEEVHALYFTKYGGNLEFHWDWSNDGAWHEREYGEGHHFLYKISDGTFTFVDTPDEGSGYVKYEIENEGSTTASTVVSIKTEEAKDYTYFNGLGWYQHGFAMKDEGETYPEIKAMLLSNPQAILDRGLYIERIGELWKVISATLWDGGRTVRILTIRKDDNVVYRAYRLGNNASLEYDGSDCFLTGYENKYVMEGEKGILGGYFYSYDYIIKDSAWYNGWEETDGDRLISGNFPNGHKVAFYLAKEGVRQRIRGRLEDEFGNEYEGCDWYEWDTAKEWNKDFGDFKMIVKSVPISGDIDGDYYQGRTLLINIKNLSPDANSTLPTTLRNGRLTFNNYGYIHIDTVPSRLINNNGSGIIQYSKEDIKIFVEETTWQGTQEEYDALATHDSNITYFIEES